MDVRHLADIVLNEIDTRALQDMSTRQPVGQMSWSQMRRTNIKLEKMSVGQTLFDQMLRHHIEALQCAGSVLLVDALLLIELQLYGEAHR
jgi:hypothetical protein